MVFVLSALADEGWQLHKLFSSWNCSENQFMTSQIFHLKSDISKSVCPIAFKCVTVSLCCMYRHSIFCGTRGLLKEKWTNWTFQVNKLNECHYLFNFARSRKWYILLWNKPSATNSSRDRSQTQPIEMQIAVCSLGVLTKQKMRMFTMMVKKDSEDFQCPFINCSKYSRTYCPSEPGTVAKEDPFTI